MLRLSERHESTLKLGGCVCFLLKENGDKKIKNSADFSEHDPGHRPATNKTTDSAEINLRRMRKGSEDKGQSEQWRRSNPANERSPLSGVQSQILRITN